jgi:hypothetical protein
LKAVEDLIERGKYFTINRARQYGKTTTLDMIWRRLSERYIVVPLSFEAVGDSAYASEEALVNTFAKMMVAELNSPMSDATFVNIWKDCTAKTLDDLALVITEFCQKAPKPVVVTIDEVDKSSNNQLFLNFLGMLRNRYLERNRKGMGYTFHSVILAGVYDVPWNIAADFKVDMTFHPEEIAQMLTDYENDVHTGMDIKAVSEEIYKYTFGYPFLVSKLCKVIDEELEKDWTVEGVQTATKETILEKNTLFTSLTKNLENYPELKRFIYAISILGDTVTYDVNNPVMDFATMFSIIKCDERRKVRIHNIIFEEVLNNYFIAEQSIADLGKLRFEFNHGGKNTTANAYLKF